MIEQPVLRLDMINRHITTSHSYYTVHLLPRFAKLDVAYYCFDWFVAVL